MEKKGVVEVITLAIAIVSVWIMMFLPVVIYFLVSLHAGLI